ncbi:hypothetical protein BSP239C_01857 [Brevibacterium sp. 239c]|uniref:hypothetical protein n=1 Tax=Brevibacterium sp. 239c TaxID=1965356 RepID=UPI000C5C6AC4|nr:hypothetical protein [Brevibacterium sp. 239c]SMX86685.1 hypothetical protein BSP239C_01857 [Brevibacterium sp. 239c]
MNAAKSKASIIQWIIVGIGVLAMCGLLFARSQGLIGFGAQSFSALILLAVVTSAGIWVSRSAHAPQKRSKPNK